MGKASNTSEKPPSITKTSKGENGLHNLALYYQSLFDIEENINHYSKNEYQNAKRKFVKYLMNNRGM